ncbi:MAG TPA: fimbrial protein [Lelliottia sp.]
MKVKILAGMLTATLSFTLYAADTNINITGKVVAMPCIVIGGNTNLDVDLGDIPANLLQSPSSSSAEKPFTLDLTNCPAGTTSVVTRFTGTSDPVAGINYYKNNGTATNVAVALIQASTSNLKGTGTTITQNVQSGSVTFALKAKAYSSAGNTTPGTINATVVAAMTYN